MSKEVGGPTMEDELLGEMGGMKPWVSLYMEREFGVDDEEMVVDNKKNEQVAMNDEGETITVLVKDQDVLKEVVLVVTESTENELPGESGDDAVDGIKTMTI